MRQQYWGRGIDSFIKESSRSLEWTLMVPFWWLNTDLTLVRSEGFLPVRTCVCKLHLASTHYFRSTINFKTPQPNMYVISFKFTVSIQIFWTDAIKKNLVMLPSVSTLALWFVLYCIRFYKYKCFQESQL